MLYFPINSWRQSWIYPAETASTSGTAVDFTGIPPWIRKITLSFIGVSTSGTSPQIVQIGDSGGVETSGYLGSATSITGSPVVANYTDGFGLSSGTAATAVYHGAMTLVLTEPSTNSWVAFFNGGRSDATAVQVSGGTKSLSGVLDRVRLTTQGGSDTFDAGTVNILYE